MQLSKNLTLEEVIKSNTAKRLNIDNTPTEEHLYNLQILAERLFQPIRNHFDVPIYISSGYRSRELNKALKGSKTSFHVKGMAIDIDQAGRGVITNKEIFYFIKDNLEFSELIWEFGGDQPDWVHVAYNENALDAEVLRSYKESGVTKYEYFKI